MKPLACKNIENVDIYWKGSLFYLKRVEEEDRQ